MGRSSSQGSSSAVRILAVVVCVLALTEIALGATYKVGDSKGWNLNFNSGSWTKGKKFSSKDVLSFVYNKSVHNVFMVSKDAYNLCTTSGGKKFASGKDSIKLGNPGTYYFICGVSNHCASGMKLAVTVSK